MLIISTLCLVLSYVFIYLPYQKAQDEKYARSFNEKYKVIQLWASRKYYESLEDLDLEEIDNKFNKEQIYNNIGKRFLRH